jgi:hypothetical protein
MSDDRPEETTPSPDLGRPKRTPPTIDLEATEISTTTAADDGAGASPPPDPEPAPAPEPDSRPPPVSPFVVAGLSGAVAAALVIGVGWMLGWPQVAPNAPAVPQLNAAVIDGLAARIASVEAKSGKSAAVTPDPAVLARLDTQEKSLASLRGELAAAQAQSDKLAAEVNQVASAPRDSAAAPDLSAIDERLSQIERTNKTQNAEIAQQNAKPADDTALRRVVAASLLDLSVRQGDPYAAALTAAKSLSPDPDALKPLEEFAATGVPNAAHLSRELLTLVPKLSPPAEAGAVTGGIVDRLEAGASRLVRIERTDATGNDRGAVIARVTAAALHNESNEARRQLMTLAPEDRTAAQSWIAKADARDTALAASRKFAADAMTALAEPRR